MSRVLDLQAARERRKSAGPPNRDADFSIDGWIVDGEVEWIYVQGVLTEDSAWTPQQQGAMLVDAAWLHATRASAAAGPTPQLWYQLDSSGHSTIIRPPSLVQGTDWRHARWFLRQWWRLTMRWWGLAWRMARGRG